MKALVVLDQDYDYDYCDTSVNCVLLVPDEFAQKDCDKLVCQWREETFIPRTGKNQYGEWKSKEYGKSTVSFYNWLRTKFQEIEMLTVDSPL